MLGVEGMKGTKEEERAIKICFWLMYNAIKIPFVQSENILE